MRRALLPAVLVAALAGGCGASTPDRVAVTLYAAGPPGAERPAVEAIQDVIARRGGLAGRFRVTFSWTAIPPGAPEDAALDAARRAVEDPRAIAYVDAGRGASSVRAVQLLNLAGVPAAAVADPTLRRALCGRDAYPSGRRTAVVPAGATEAERAAAATETVFAALRPLPPEFDRAPVTRALLQRFGRC